MEQLYYVVIAYNGLFKNIVFFFYLMQDLQTKLG